jgi:hypothetical protein
MTMNLTNNVFETKDWNEAALILSHGITLVKVRREGSCYFQFSNRMQALEIVEGFWRGDISINARAFVDSQRRIKDLIHK